MITYNLNCVNITVFLIINLEIRLKINVPYKRKQLFSWNNVSPFS